MAATIVEFDFAPGVTPTLTLFVDGSDVIANTGGDVGAEETNRGGTYLATVDEALSDWHKAYVTIDGTTVPLGWVKLADDTSTYRVVSEFEAVASAVRTNLATELARIDVATSTRNATTPLDAGGVRTAVGLSTANLATLIAATTDILEADNYIDTTPTPWQLVLIKKGTGVLGVGTELLRQNLKDETGTNLNTINDFAGQLVSP
jgi:hypothetical protein